MAHGLTCYCCGKNETSDAHYYCRDCVVKLKNMFETNQIEISESPHHSYHCISCGEHENRRIIDELLICDKFVESELKQYEQERKIIVIDGSAFDDMPGFYDEVERKFTCGLTWKIGRNLDAFNDVLRGGFGVHEYGETIAIRWLHAGKSRNDFGYGATVEHYKNVLERCHPSNRAIFEKRLDSAKNRIGQTLFEIIVEIITNSGNSGHDCTLELIE